MDLLGSVVSCIGSIMLHNRWGYVIFPLLLVSGLNNAEQLSFRTTTDQDSIQFQYQWIDGDNQIQHLEFALPASIVQSTATSHPNYNPDIAQRHIIVALYKEAQKIDPRDASISIKPDNEKINISVRSQSNEKADNILASLKAVQQNAFEHYLNAHYFTQYTTIFNQKALKPDHLRYVSESIKPLIPVSQAFYEKINRNNDARAYFNLLLSWVQSIPYSTLEDRVSSNGSGFTPPLGVILQNKGDCDSKAVLTSALVRTFLPTTKMIMVYLPHHALTGVALTPLAQDETIEFDGETYILYDPTGPALLPFGQVSPETKNYIITGRYQVESIEE